MAGPLGSLRAVVHGAAALAVLLTMGAGVAAAVVQSGGFGADPAADRGSAPPTPHPTVSPTDLADPFPTPAGGFDYTTWASQDGGDGSRYRVPPGWEVRPASSIVTTTDADGAVLARGRAPAYYYGNTCVDQGEPIAGAWTVLADPVDGTDPAAAAEDAVLAWARGFARNASGTVAPMSEPRTEPITTDSGVGARSWVTVDMGVFDGPCLPEVAEVAVTTVALDGRLQSLVQARYLLNSRGMTDGAWAAVAASLTGSE